MAAFVAIAERRSFAKAATHLGVARSTLSQNIRALEERLRVRLLNRTTCSVSLTEAGERLLARVRPALVELTAARTNLTDPPKSGRFAARRRSAAGGKFPDGSAAWAVSQEISRHPIGYIGGQDAGQYFQRRI